MFTYTTLEVSHFRTVCSKSSHLITKMELIYKGLWRDIINIRIQYYNKDDVL